MEEGTGVRGLETHQAEHAFIDSEQGDLGIGQGLAGGIGDGGGEVHRFPGLHLVVFGLQGDAEIVGAALHRQLAVT